MKSLEELRKNRVFTGPALRPQTDEEKDASVNLRGLPSSSSNAPVLEPVNEIQQSAGDVAENEDAERSDADSESGSSSSTSSTSSSSGSS